MMNAMHFRAGTVVVVFLPVIVPFGVFGALAITFV